MSGNNLILLTVLTLVYHVSGFIEVTTNFIINTDVSLNFTNGQKYCLDNYGTELATVLSLSQYSEIGDTPNVGNIWIGGTRQPGVLNKWIWTETGQIFWNETNQQEIGYAKWANGKPNNFGGNQNCLIYSQGVFGWDDANCDDPYPIVCNRFKTLISCNSGPIKYAIDSYNDIRETFKLFSFEYLSSYDNDFQSIIISTCNSNSSLDTKFTLSGSGIGIGSVITGCTNSASLAHYKSYQVGGEHPIGWTSGETYLIDVGLENNPPGYTPGDIIDPYILSLEIICEPKIILECNNPIIATTSTHVNQVEILTAAVFFEWTYLGTENLPITITTCYTENSNYQMFVGLFDEQQNFLAQETANGCPEASGSANIIVNPTDLSLVAGATYYIFGIPNAGDLSGYPSSFRIGVECGDSNVECNIDSGNYTVDWDSELTQSSSSQLTTNLTSKQGRNNNGVFELTVTATADYVIRANYQSLGQYDFGVTYVLDTAQFEDADRVLFGEVGLCENRYSSEYSNLNINDDLWTYENDLTSGNFPGNNGLGMEYPESDWTLSVVDNNNICNGGIQWQRTLSLNNLTSCGFEYSEDSNNIYLSGIFYLTLVSPQPIGYDGDSNLPDSALLSTTEYQYITKQLESLEVVIQFQKALSIVQDAEVQLFGSFIISSDFDRDTNTFEVTILTYVPRYVEIADISSLSVTNSLIGDWSYIEDDSYSSDCFVQDSYRCWQKFIFSRTINECSNDISVNLDDTMNILSDITCVGEEISVTTPAPSVDCANYGLSSCISNIDCGADEECHPDGCCRGIPQRGCNPDSFNSCPTVLFNSCGCSDGMACTGLGGLCICTDGYVWSDINTWPDDEACVRCNVDRDCQEYLGRTDVVCTNYDCIDENTGIPIDYTNLRRRRLQNDAAACDEFLNNINDFQSNEINTGTLSFAYTEGCDDSLYEIDFSDAVSLTLYTDDTFTIEQTDAYPSNGPRVYFKVSIASPFSNYNVLGFTITSAYLCTADLLTGSIPTSCVNPIASDNIDISLMYTLTTDASVDWILSSNNNASDNIESGSFILPLTADDIFFIEIIIELNLNDNSRRRVLLQNGNNNYINRYTQGFVSGNVDSSIIDDNNNSNNGNNNSIKDNNLILLIVLIIGGIIILGVLFFGIYYFKYQKMKKQVENNNFNKAVIKVTSGSVDIIESNSNTATNTPTVGSTQPIIKTFQPVTV